MESCNSVMELITKANSDKIECKEMEHSTTALASQLTQACGPTIYSMATEFSSMKTQSCYNHHSILQTLMMFKITG